MRIKIALAGNPNSGKTTLFNALTGSNQYVGNWPGVTVEKKEGNLKKQEDVIITDLPGIYSLSPYTPEEIVARDYLINERPDAILNIVDGTNIERNLYLTTQLMELGIPVVIAINMMDAVRKNGDKIDTEKLSDSLKCNVVEISALKGLGIEEAVKAAIDAATNKKLSPVHFFPGNIEHAIAHIEEATVHDLPEDRQRWYAIKIFERDPKVLEQMDLSDETLAHIEKDIVAVESKMDDDAESIIINERYNYVSDVLKTCYKKRSTGKITSTEKIDRVVTNRWLALPIFMAIMFLVYYISISTVGTVATDWVGDGVFGDGWYFLGIGTEEYEEKSNSVELVDSMILFAEEQRDIDVSIYTDAQDADSKRDAAKAILLEIQLADIDNDNLPDQQLWTYEDEETYETYYVTSDEVYAAIDIAHSVNYEEPYPSDYGPWIPGFSALATTGLNKANAPVWLNSLIVDGIIGGVGSVLSFVPQLFVLFLFLAFLEGCGYMSRVAFVLDRIFRKFGLSGKSFIPMLIGSGCSVPGIMASRTIENERDRRITVITTSFIPCGAKLPMIAMITAALFGGPGSGWWLAPVCYFAGILAVVLSGLMLKKTKLFSGDPSPFVMELPMYHLPTVGSIFRSMWERGWSFIKKAGTIILLSTIILWLGNTLGVVDGRFGFYLEMPEHGKSVIDYIGSAICWIFAPLGFGDPTAAVATFMGLIAKEEVVAVFGVTDFAGLGRLVGFSFLMFNLLCAPCFAAMGAIRREMNSWKWTAFAISYQCIFAYAVCLIIHQFGLLFTGAMGGINILWLCISFLLLGFMLFMIFKPFKDSQKKGKKLNQN
ncbi:MAG: ferrous iron transporter B [Ruminococcaceae bacterium]|nr:ferrous iron transporter B [Oscillospiraceae bacterium]